MLTVTDAALEHLHAALTRAQAIESCFRFTENDENSLGLVVQEPDSDDHTFDYDGETVLATPDSLSDVLSRKVLDLDEDGQLILLPKAESV